MPTPPVVVKAWQQKRAEPFKSRHQSVAISAFPIINLCQLCLAECVGFSRGDDRVIKNNSNYSELERGCLRNTGKYPLCFRDNSE